MPQSQANKSLCQLEIPTPREFNFDECLVFLGRSDKDPLHVISGRKVRKAIEFGGNHFLIDVSSPGPDKLRIELLNDVITPELTLQLIAFIEEWFDLKRNILPFYELAEKDRLLKDLVQRFYGLRLIKIHDLFQALCWAILGQQINIGFAYTLFQRYIHKYGDFIRFENNNYWLFPQEKTISKLTVSELQTLQMTRRKAEYLIELAKTLLHRKQELRALHPYEAQRELLKLRGIGIWTTNYVLMRCYGAPDAFPADDIGLQNAIRFQLNLAEKPSNERIREISAGWQNWYAYAAFYLYRSLL